MTWAVVFCGHVSIMASHLKLSSCFASPSAMLLAINTSHSQLRYVLFLFFKTNQKTTQLSKINRQQLGLVFNLK